jgi:hypothetical protein
MKEAIIGVIIIGCLLIISFCTGLMIGVAVANRWWRI